MASKNAKKNSQPLANLLIARDDDEAMAYAIACGSANLSTRKAIDKDSGNEDTAALIPCGTHSAVLVVADGVGGMPAGKAASRRVVDTLASSVAKAEANNRPLRGAILDALETANRNILSAGTGNATTVAVVEIDGEIARPYHVGDSQILVTGQRGRLKLQTMAHSPTGYALESGLMDEQQALKSDDRHYVDNVVGAVDMRIEIGAPLKLALHDTLVIASDGLWDNMYAEEVIEIVRKGPLTPNATLLMDRVQNRISNPRPESPSHTDDVTFILYRRR